MNATFESMKKVSERQKRQLRAMAAATLLGMPLIAWIIARYAEIDLWVRWTGEAAFWKQLLIGVPAGLISGFLALLIIRREFMRGVRVRYARMIGELNLNWSEILFISMCAGVGEELLFRGVLQPLIGDLLGSINAGIVMTAFLFVAIHGYLNPRDWRISVYGAFMTLVIAGLGWLTELYGVWTAVIAHALIDVILLADDSDDDLKEEIEASDPLFTEEDEEPERFA